MTKQERKSFKKTKGKDRILLNKPNQSALRHLAPSDSSKKIKKGFVKKDLLTSKQVRMKAKSHRLVVPTSKLK